MGNTFRSNLGQVALNVARERLVAMARAIHNFSEPLTEAVVFVSGTARPNDPDGLRVNGEIVENTMSPRIFGVISLIEHYPCAIKGITGFIDFMFVINQVEDRPLITPDQINIVAGDAHLITRVPQADIRKQVSDEWNS